jgi:hypothetical protein
LAILSQSKASPAIATAAVLIHRPVFNAMA